MKKAFTLGAVSGITALAIGFPIAAQFAGAQEESTSSSATRPVFEKRMNLTQDDVQNMIDRDNEFLLHIDAFVAIQKEAIQNHRIALEAAADIEDDDARNEAVKAARDAMRTEIESAIDADPDLKDLKMMPFGGPGKKGPRGEGMHHAHGPEKMAELLGMTPDELKADIDSGKTIDQIAEEKGIELPERPMFHGDR